MNGHKRENDRIPSAQHHPLKLQIMQLASWQYTPRVTRLRDSRFDKGGKVSAALELVLYAEAALGAEIPRPLGVNFTFKVEGMSFVCKVTRENEEDEGDPKKEGVDGEEGSVVE